MSDQNGENDIDAGLLLHELRNVNQNEDEDEDEIIREQRERMPDIAFMRQSGQNEVDQENVPPGLLSRSNLIFSQPDPLRRTLNDNRETFPPNGSKSYHRDRNWDQPLGDAVYNIYEDIFDLLTKWTNVKIRKTLEALRNEETDIAYYMTEITNEDMKKYFGTLLTQTIFKGNHMTIRDWIIKLPKTMSAWGRPNCYWISIRRFDWIRRHLDCGDNVKVDKLDQKGKVIYSNRRDPQTQQLIPKKALCLKTKFDSLYDSFNTISIKQKEPKDNIIALDESMRPSYSWKDPCKVYMPNKPVKDWIFNIKTSTRNDFSNFPCDIRNQQVITIILM